MKLINKIWNSKVWLLIIIVLLVAVNWLASLYHTRIDLTNEKRFTLSKPTKKILRKLDDEVNITVFLEGNLNSGFKNLRNAADELLQEFKEVAGNKIHIKFINPENKIEGSDISYADSLANLGLPGINMKSQVKEGELQQFVYPYAFIAYKDNILPVTLFDISKVIPTANGEKGIGYKALNSAEAMIEFEFADGIYKLSQTSKPMLAYSIGNDEIKDVRAYDLANNVLLSNYDLRLLNLNTQPLDADTFKLLMIVKPSKPFSDLEKLKIDQFLMRGGKLLMFVDKLNAELDSLQSLSKQVVAYDRNLELNDLLFKYGARINSDLVMDLQCDFLPFIVNGKDQMDYLHWNYFPLFESGSDHIINKNLGLVSSQFVNSIDTVEAEGIKKTILLSSSANSRTISTPALISGAENVNAPEDAQFKKAHIPVAVLLEGKFQSLFTNRLSQALADTLARFGTSFQQQCTTDNKVIVVADGDMVLNAVFKDAPLPMGMNRFTYGSQYQYQFANKDFLQNCLDYMINQSGLLEAKSKDYTLRLLDKKQTDDQRTTWQVINIAVPILLLILFAIIYQWMRKRKYTK